MAANAADRYAEAYRLLLPFADAGDTEAQGIVGSYLMAGLHRFETLAHLRNDAAAVDDATSAADRERAGVYLAAASAAGVGPASFNLASLYVMGYGGEPWEERRAKAAELYALAHAQGFTCFAHLMDADGPGQPYLGLMERAGVTGG